MVGRRPPHEHSKAGAKAGLEDVSARPLKEVLTIRRTANGNSIYARLPRLEVFRRSSWRTRSALRHYLLAFSGNSGWSIRRPLRFLCPSDLLLKAGNQRSCKAQLKSDRLPDGPSVALGCQHQYAATVRDNPPPYVEAVAFGGPKEIIKWQMEKLALLSWRGQPSYRQRYGCLDNRADDEPSCASKREENACYHGPPPANESRAGPYSPRLTGASRKSQENLSQC
jgi:hypothetical protein